MILRGIVATSTDTTIRCDDCYLGFAGIVKTVLILFTERGFHGRVGVGVARSSIVFTR
jgi:hypothetical protein